MFSIFCSNQTTKKGRIFEKMKMHGHTAARHIFPPPMMMTDNRRWTMVQKAHEMNLNTNGKSKMTNITSKFSHSFYQISPLVGGCLIMTSSGSVYLVAAYSSKLQMMLGMTTADISTFGTLVAAGSWMSIIPYAFTDRFGPKLTVLIGVVMMMSSYIMIALAANGKLDLSASSVIACGFFVGFGSSWTHASSLVTNAANTSPEHRGSVIGLLQANFALSSGIYTQFLQIFSLDIPVFLFLTGSLMSLCDLIAYPLNNRIVGNEREEGAPLETDPLFILPLAVLTSLTAIFLAMAAIFQVEFFHYCVLMTYSILFFGVLILSLSMLYIYHDQVLWCKKSIDKNLNDDFELNSTVESVLTCCSATPPSFNRSLSALGTSEEEKIGLLSSASTNGENNHSSSYTTKPNFIVPQVCLPTILESGGVNGALDKPEPLSLSSSNKVMVIESPQELKSCVFTRKFWIMFLCYVIGVGSGLTVLDNITKIVDSHSTLGTDDDVHSDLKTNAVALFSSFNTFGRIGFGFASDWLSTHMNISRSWLLSFNCAMMGISTLFMGYVSLSSFNYAVMLTATSYGGFLMLIPTLVADFFGFIHYGSILGLMNFAPMIGTEVFYNFLSTYLYDKQLTEGTLLCYDNPACFRLTFIILSLCCFMASVLAAMMPPAKPKTSPKP